jgi:hypothetical protein
MKPDSASPWRGGAYTAGNFEELRITSGWWQRVIQRFTVPAYAGARA